MKRLIVLLIILLLTFYTVITRLNRGPEDPLEPSPQDEGATTIPTERPDLYSNNFDLIDFDDCTVYLRSSMNVPGSPATLPDRSEVRCNINGIYEPIIVVTDKESYPNAKNNIYNIWDSKQGIKLMIVDQHGAGSGEGVGKIVLVTEVGIDIESCFYYSHESFHDEYNLPYAVNAPPTAKGLETIKKTAKSVSSSECTNFNVNTFNLR